MADHAVVRTDNMSGTDVRSGLVSVKYMVGTTPTAIDNGNVVKVGALLDGQREIHEATKVTVADDIKDIALIANPEIMYDERLKSLEDYYNEAGKPVRAYRLHSGDVFAVTIDALAGVASPAVGNIVELAAGTKLKVVTSATSGSTTVGSIMEVETVGKYKYYVIQVA